MKKILTCTIIYILAISQANAVDTEQLTQESRAAIKALGSELKSTLQASMKANGIIETISQVPIFPSRQVYFFDYGISVPYGQRTCLSLLKFSEKSR